MNKKYYTLLFFFLLFLNSNAAQNRTLKGILTDSLQNPIEYANIIAKPADPNLDLSFSLTDDKGRYQLHFLKNKTYQVEARYLGYEPTIFTIDSAFQLTEKNIILRPAKNELAEVIVIENLPVSYKGDTILYQTDAFTNGEERKLKQVLKKLPGVEVDKKGVVTVHGKKVDKMLVEGEDFFGGGSKLAVENIPADAVEEVEVIDNYNEIRFLSEVSGSDKLAMNIKLKEDKKNFVFGEVTAGGGVEENYLIHPNLFYYSPKTNFNFIGDLNNVGEEVFTFTDQMNFEGGIGKMLANPTSFFDQMDFSLLQPEEVKKNNNTFSGLNFKQKINTKIKMDGYAILSRSKTLEEEFRVNQYVTDSFPTVENRSVIDEKINTLGMAKLSITYVPKPNVDVSYNFLLKKISNDSDRANQLETNDDNNFVITGYENNVRSIRQNFERHQKHSRKYTSSLAVNHLFKEGETIKNWLTDSEFISFLIPLQEEAPYDISQLKNTKFHQLDGLWKHYFILNKKNHIYLTLGNNWLNQKYFTNETQQLENGTRIDFQTEGFGNDINFYLNDGYVGLHYRFKKGKATTNLGTDLHYYYWKIQEEIINKKKWVFTPKVKTDVEFSSAEKLEFEYSVNSSFQDASIFANRLYLRSFNALYYGNPNLENELYHYSSIRYFKSSWYDDYNVNTSISYQRKTQRIQNEITLLEITQYISPMMVSTPSSKWNFRFKFRKGIKRIDLKLRSNFSISKFDQFINTQELDTKETTSRWGVAMETNFKKYPNIEIGFDQRTSTYKFGTTNSKFIRKEPYLNIKYAFFNGFLFSFDYYQTNFESDSGSRSVYSLADASLFYQKEDSPWGLELKAINLLDVNEKRQATFSNTIISDVNIAVLPRIFLLKVSYNL